MLCWVFASLELARGEKACGEIIGTVCTNKYSEAPPHSAPLRRPVARNPTLYNRIVMVQIESHSFTQARAAHSYSSSQLSGPPKSVRMKWGYVVLSAGKSVGKHSTDHHEEVLVVLEGEGDCG
jgi:hypothetical protein